MSNIKTVRVGQMPGQINEFAVEVGTSISALIQLAGLTATGFEVKVDGSTVSNLSGTFVTASTNLVILAKQVKGNAVKTVRVGQMPGQINEYAVEEGTTIKALIALAGLNTQGFEVKVDGRSVTNLDAEKVTSSTNLVILAKQVKGNADIKTVRVGQMPGQINEYAVEVGTSIAKLVELAGLSSTGFEVKVDGQTVSNLSGTFVTASTNLVILAKQVKGNK